MENLFPANRGLEAEHINSSIYGSQPRSFGNPARVLIGASVWPRTAEPPKPNRVVIGAKRGTPLPVGDAPFARGRLRRCRTRNPWKRRRRDGLAASPPGCPSPSARASTSACASRLPPKNDAAQRRLRRLSAIAPPPARVLDRPNRRAHARSRAFSCFRMWIPTQSRRLSTSPASVLAAVDLPSPTPLPHPRSIWRASRTRTSSRPSTTVPDRRSPAPERTFPSAKRCGASSGA